MSKRILFYLTREFSVSLWSDCASVHRLAGDENVQAIMDVTDVMIAGGLLDIKHGGIMGFYEPTREGVVFFQEVETREDYKAWCANE